MRWRSEQQNGENYSELKENVVCVACEKLRGNENYLQNLYRKILKTVNSCRLKDNIRIGFRYFGSDISTGFV